MVTIQFISPSSPFRVKKGLCFYRFSHRDGAIWNYSDFPTGYSTMQLNLVDEYFAPLRYECGIIALFKFYRWIGDVLAVFNLEVTFMKTCQ
jgi:hypothetical protein